MVLILAATIAGCSSESSQPPEPSPTNDVGQTPEDVSSALPVANPEVSTQKEALSLASNANTANELTETLDDEATKFIGQDGRERVVPTGPPPTDQDGRLELTFDDLSFEMEKGGKFERSMLTDRIKNFDGADVRLRGFIKPSFRQSKIEKFVFVRDDKECCFGPGAAIYDNALVSLKKGSQTEYTVRPVVVTGQLRLKEYETPGGMILSIYRIKNGKIE